MQLTRELVNRDNKVIQRKKQSTNDREGIPNSGWNLGCPFTRNRRHRRRNTVVVAAASIG